MRRPSLQQSVCQQGWARDIARLRARHDAPRLHLMRARRRARGPLSEVPRALPALGDYGTEALDGFKIVPRFHMLPIPCLRTKNRARAGGGPCGASEPTGDRCAVCAGAAPTHRCGAMAMGARRPRREPARRVLPAARARHRAHARPV